MRKTLVIGIAVLMIMSMFCFTGCGSKDKNKSGTICTEFTDNGTVDSNGDKWIRHSFYSDDASFALKQAKESASYHLVRGATVSEIEELESYDGSHYYSFKVKY